MKKILLYMASLLALLNLSSCFEDEGNYDYVDLQPFVVDTVGVNTSFTVSQFENLNVPSRLIYGGNKSDLDFVWTIYGDNTYGENRADTLATTENFNQEITTKPGSYILKFCATERNTGLCSTMLYHLTIESAVGSGLMVFYNKNASCDIDIIKTKTFIGSVQDNKLVRNIYSRIKSNISLRGNPWMIHRMEGYMDIFTDETGVRVSPDDMSLITDFNGMFWEKPDVCKPQGYYSMDESDNLFVNNGELYVLLGSWSNGNPYYAGARAITGESYVASPYCTYSWGRGAFAYDMLNCRFIWGDQWSGEMQVVPSEKMSNLDMDLHCLQHGFTTEEWTYYAYGVLNERNSDKWHLYAMSTGYSPDAHKVLADFDITSAKEISKSRFYEISEVSPLMYYASANSIYVCPFDLSSATATCPSKASWSSPAGEEITYMQLFRGQGINLTESAANKYLLVATWNGTEGKIYILKTDMASGVIDTTPVETYGGFGKIGTITFKER